MSFSAIESALNARLAALTPAIDVAWPGLRYEPQAGRPYLRPQFEPVETAIEGQHIGASAPIRQGGLFVVRAVYPLDQGPGPVRAKAEALVAHFARGLSLTAGASPNTFPVRIEAVSRGGLVEDEGLSSIGVTARWLAFRPA